MGARDTAMTLLQEAGRLLPALTKLRRHLHAHPELGFEEYATAALVAARLRRLGLRVRSHVGRTGVVAVLQGASRGPTLAFRACMDALPVTEPRHAPYASRSPGRAHACGHDAQVAILLGAVALLAPRASMLRGRVALIFQPAEELDAGARAMLADGLLQNPRLDAMVGFHGQPELPLGRVGVSPGPVMAAIDTFRLTIEGRGGHGALPHQTADPIVAAAAAVVGLQTVVSRGVDPREAAVVTVGCLRAGETSNVIPPRAELAGTVRALRPAVRRCVEARLRQVVERTCAALGTRARLDYRAMLPPLVNDPRWAARLRQAAAAVLGPRAVVTAAPSMGGDDFSHYLAHVPGCYVWLGERASGRPVRPWHHPAYDVDDRVIPIGAAVLAQVALDFLGDGGPAPRARPR
ncbi:MAG: amidohydrolase [Deltaproteobacteria bacterium]|nr:amidohydrolase [Deltaproteobacteria bacterium]